MKMSDNTKKDSNFPISFYLLKSIKIDKKNSRDLYFYANKYSGLSKSIPYFKPISKLVDWDYIDKSLNKKQL